MTFSPALPSRNDCISGQSEGFFKHTVWGWNPFVSSGDSPCFTQTLINLKVELSTLCRSSPRERFALQTAWPVFNKMPSAL